MSDCIIVSFCVFSLVILYFWIGYRQPRIQFRIEVKKEYIPGNHRLFRKVNIAPILELMKKIYYISTYANTYNL